jgi:drug/metabolite transporter (DMT)-like permease
LAEPDTTSSIPKAAAWMAGWLACVLVMIVAGREAQRQLSVFEVMEVRSLIGICLLYPLIHLDGGIRAMKTANLKRQILRNIVHYGAQCCWLTALTLIPLAQVISIEFTMPIWTAILAVTFLREHMGPWKITAVALGLVGVVIIVRPFNGTVSPGQLIALVAAVGYAISVILVKSLTRTDRVTVIMFWMVVIQSVLGVGPALAVWQWPSMPTWGWLLVIGFTGTYSHFCLTKALVHADATIVIPMDFLRVPLAALTGWLVYMERIDLLTAAGAALILSGNLLNLKAAKT